MNSEGIDLPLIACAHELKTPLILMRQLSFELESTTDIKRRTEICRQMRLTSERSLRLADNLAKMARLENALFELEPIQVTGLCYEVVNELIPLTSAIEQEVVVKSARKSPVCVGNRDLLRSLLMGLLDNALQYTTENGKIYITTCIKNDKIELAVRDNGPIIDLVNFKKLKSNLGKKNQPISARPLASSLGISVAEKFVNAMNGQLLVSRHHSGGMTFKALLPTSRQLSILEL